MLVNYKGKIFNTNEFSHLKVSKSENYAYVDIIMNNGNKISLYDAGHIYNYSRERRRSIHETVDKVKKEFGEKIGAKIIK